MCPRSLAGQDFGQKIALINTDYSTQCHGAIHSVNDILIGFRKDPWVAFCTVGTEPSISNSASWVASESCKFLRNIAETSPLPHLPVRHMSSPQRARLS
ncbi:hypothetical protein CERZMDRAFT_90971 [Cercospora zeae-maydis SCOH1-5]|uniref:Uncharacterized protein n=1 Tax=Cercospora zeae-maydis SCOH1-5 TaxID=717836 RepID=A0A6A6FCX8_9PEZI|nr:hypothetical protein CERZMDRAFT_90971 [Cercospora zeae-maydis SCOH1-5]